MPSQKRQWSTANIGRRVKKICISPTWGELNVDVLELIFNRLSFVDVGRARAVCSHWHSVATGLDHHHQVPWLLIPPSKEEEDKTSSEFLDLEEGKIYVVKNLSSEIAEGQCIGSSYGHLIFLDERLTPFVLNPLTKGIPIELPSIVPLGIINVQRSKQQIAESIKDPSSREFVIAKAIFSSDPSREINNYQVALICGRNRKLAFWKHGDRSWNYLDGQHQPYCDIIFHENHLYAINEYGAVEAWDFSGEFPTKKANMKALLPKRMGEVIENMGRDRCSTNFYLVKNCGKILLVIRYIGEFVDGNGELLTEADLLTDHDPQPMICPYKTGFFEVCELDPERETWVDVNTLNGQTLFLGGNQSMSASVGKLSSGCREDCIYFTDDYWLRMDEDEFYGGHDMGVFCLGSGLVEEFYDFGAIKQIQPPPCWVLPNPWQRHN